MGVYFDTQWVITVVNLDRKFLQLPMPRKTRQQDTRRHQRNLQYLRSLKNKPCMDCKGSFPPIVMQFDHRDPSQKRMGTRRCMSALKTITSINREVAKCDVVCANCHMIRTEEKRLFGAYRFQKQSETPQIEFKLGLA